ncbi:MAG: folate-binding protein YgfZ [Dactylosporangium sp.]|nr:folate-binding protein [Dactylosporangium sp.]NNJ61737.1 folate-binding protein YgfZ [Dactylosporangium sp.]
MIDFPGAVAVGALDADHPDAGVPAHYGDPSREQRILATEVGLVDRSNAGVLAVAGADRLGWLHGLTSQYLTDLAPMSGTELLLLSPHGHVEEHAGVLDDGETTWLDCPPGRAEPLLAFLAGMAFLLQVDPVDRSGDRALLSLVGPATGEALASLGAGPLAEPDVLPVPPPKFEARTVPSRPSAMYAAGQLPAFDGLVRRVPGGADLLVPRSASGDVAAAVGVPTAGIWAYEALRVADRRPRLGFETDHKTLPSEVGWTRAVHFHKGCYRGQEAVARVHHLGRPPRRLVLLHLDGLSSQAVPERHTPVLTAGGERVGMIGTGARHFELGPIALALIRASAARTAAAGGTLRVGGIAASIDPD